MTRNQLIRDMALKGYPYTYIGHEFNISRQRVHQIAYNYKTYGNSRTITKLGVYKCQVCDSDGPLQLHHIDKDCTNNRAENLMVVCRACHIKVEGKRRQRC